MAKDWRELYEKLPEESKARVESFVSRELAILEGKANRHEPPFDGVPCPMCPMEIRNLAAVAHNLAWRIGTASACKVSEKWGYLREAVASVDEKKLIDETSPEPLRNLLSTCRKIAGALMLTDLFWLKTELEQASLAVQPLTDAHFANTFHSHGTVG